MKTWTVGRNRPKAWERQREQARPGNGRGVSRGVGAEQRDRRRSGTVPARGEEGGRDSPGASREEGRDSPGASWEAGRDSPGASWLGGRDSPGASWEEGRGVGGASSGTVDVDPQL
jgi:hypothetical protein